MQHHRLGRVLGQPLAGELVAGLVLVQVQLQPRQTLRWMRNIITACDWRSATSKSADLNSRS